MLEGGDRSRPDMSEVLGLIHSDELLLICAGIWKDDVLLFFKLSSQKIPNGNNLATVTNASRTNLCVVFSFSAVLAERQKLAAMGHVFFRFTISRLVR